MLVKCYGVLEKYPEVELDIEASNMREVLSLIKLHYGPEFSETLLTKPFYYVLGKVENPEDIVVLAPEVFLTTIDGYNKLTIFPEIEGGIAAPAVAAALSAMGASALAASAVATTAIAFIANVALSVGLNMLMSMLSPTPEFSSDPAKAQNNVSNLFNGAPILREQGGSVPLIFGEPYCGGYLISSGLFTEEL